MSASQKDGSESDSSSDSSSSSCSDEGRSKKKGKSKKHGHKHKNHNKSVGHYEKLKQGRRHNSVKQDQVREKHPFYRFYKVFSFPNLVDRPSNFLC